MKICILSTSYPRSSGDHWVTFMHSFAKELAKTEDVTVVSSADAGAKDFEIRDKVAIYRFNYFIPRSMQRLTYTGGMRESFKREILPKIQAPFFMISFLIKSLRIAKDCDVINAHWVISGLCALPLKWIYKKPVVLTEHGGSLRGLPRWLNKFVLKRMDVITSAHYDMLQSIKDMGINNAVDIKNFLDEEKFLRRHNLRQIRDSLGMREEFVVTFIGRLEELKDPLTFIQSIPHAIKKIKNIKFIMLGDGHLRDEVRKRIKDLKLENHLQFLGPKPDVDNYLSISDIFVACSATENCFSTTILEAMLSKVPCIITKAGLTEKFFVDGRDACLVEKKNPKMLGAAIADLLENSALRKELSKNGLKFLDRNGFRNRVIKKKILKVLRDSVKK